MTKKIAYILVYFELIWGRIVCFFSRDAEFERLVRKNNKYWNKCVEDVVTSKRGQESPANAFSDLEPIKKAIEQKNWFELNDLLDQRISKNKGNKNEQ